MNFFSPKNVKEHYVHAKKHTRVNKSIINEAIYVIRKISKNLHSRKKCNGMNEINTNEIISVRKISNTSTAINEEFDSK